MQQACSRATLGEANRPELTDEQHAQEPAARHQTGKLHELLFARVMCLADDGDCIHTCSCSRVFSEQFKPSEIDEHVREQIRTFGQHTRQLWHHFPRLLDPRR